MSGSCVVDAGAVRQFGGVARQAFREISGEGDGVTAVADLLPQSRIASAWCESLCTTADLMRHSAEWFGWLADYVEHVVVGYLTADLASAQALDRAGARA
ncbi:hypothetical protein [Nocardia terpenica]|uniref:Uncharacterized protein n=1 Tax=Nocardia terpenica TaxID=455432 RepID=A0A164PQI1_9NOCA|nr:hypothetical protein [Nocardia terpenica]KZM75916.1 hypothetical protein AWN90_16415 [Nocardia terpenica]